MYVYTLFMYVHILYLCAHTFQAAGKYANFGNCLKTFRLYITNGRYMFVSKKKVYNYIYTCFPPQFYFQTNQCPPLCRNFLGLYNAYIPDH